MTNFFFGGGFEAVFFLMFFLVSGIIFLNLIKGMVQWNKNNHSPRLTVDAAVVSRRSDVSHHDHVSADAGGTHYHTAAGTSYYITFQVESGDRMELQVSGSEYGMLAEGDQGRLSFQGTRYLGFERV